MARQTMHSRTPQTPLMIGPRDHGVTLTLREFHEAQIEEGFDYELIDGALDVSPTPSPVHSWWLTAIRDQLCAYSARRPDRVNFVAGGSEVAIPGRPGPTRPKPDVAAFRDFPHPPPSDWEFVCPIVVADVISLKRTERDTRRNRHLYWQADDIQEYWIVDTSRSVQKPSLIALSRRVRGDVWKERRIPFGTAYRTALLPSFSLNLKQASRG